MLFSFFLFRIAHQLERYLTTCAQKKKNKNQFADGENTKTNFFVNDYSRFFLRFIFLFLFFALIFFLCPNLTERKKIRKMFYCFTSQYFRLDFKVLRYSLGILLLPFSPILFQRAALKI